MICEWGGLENGGGLCFVVCVQGRQKIHTFRCMPDVKLMLNIGNSSLMILRIDVERSVVITSISKPSPMISFMPLLKPSGSMATELPASVD